MNENIVEILSRLGLTISTAESCTGGLISKKITDIPGSSEVFLCGVCSYSNKSKEILLKVKHKSLQTYGAVSKQVAQEMARGIQKISGSDVAVSTTGIAGPGGGSLEKPVGLVYICAYFRNKSQAICLRESSELSRENIREIVAQKAINLVMDLVSTM